MPTWREEIRCRNNFACKNAATSSFNYYQAALVQSFLCPVRQSQCKNLSDSYLLCSGKELRESSKIGNIPKFYTCLVPWKQLFVQFVPKFPSISRTILAILTILLSLQLEKKLTYPMASNEIIVFLSLVHFPVGIQRLSYRNFVHLLLSCRLAGRWTFSFRYEHHFQVVENIFSPKSGRVIILWELLLLLLREPTL